MGNVEYSKILFKNQFLPAEHSREKNWPASVSMPNSQILKKSTVFESPSSRALCILCRNLPTLLGYDPHFALRGLVSVYTNLNTIHDFLFLHQTLETTRETNILSSISEYKIIMNLTDSNRAPEPNNLLINSEQKSMDTSNVDVIGINVNADSDFRILRAGTNETLHKAFFQVCEHVKSGLYQIISINASGHSCVVVMSTARSREALVWKDEFPWDISRDT
ncbi:hypothetical protein B0J11DRAFT_512059 [Dendryphion nanum]|uniref:Uncharacterized protein n=1 Tax=Dendryphion nanum TaxID=256645 RepID=A0A9P9I8E7_9PLEO|nr:hypothetical protein B0J11DRAFT_512059 [Dendryphion nanum]